MTDAVQVVGAKQLRATLKAAGRDLTELRETNARVAAIVANAGRTGAPRRSGTLAGSVRPGATQRSGIVRAGGARVPYAQPIHWGWPRRNIRANPWLSTAATGTESAWQAVYADAVDTILATVKGM